MQSAGSFSPFPRASKTQLQRMDVFQYPSYMHDVLSSARVGYMRQEEGNVAFTTLLGEACLRSSPSAPLFNPSHIAPPTSLPRCGTGTRNRIRKTERACTH